jgi:LmbE family N-acetylglucosaminyl deacetylase
MLRNTQFGMSGPSAQATSSGSGFEILTTAPRVALAVTPHPDDCEGGCGGALAKWVKEFGTEAVVVMCTNGNKGTSERDLSPQRLAAIREEEQLAASEIIGAKDVVFLRYPDGGLEDTMLFRSQVVREIRRHRPDVILCIDPYRSTSHTHRDHRMSGRVAMDAAFTYAWSYQHFREQITDEGLQPHLVEQAYMWGSESPDIFVEIGGYLEAKTLSLEAHASQMSPVTTEERLSRISNNATRYQELTGLEYTEGFRRVQFGLGSIEWQFLYS